MKLDENRHERQEMEKSIRQVLSEVQSELHVPKDQYNSFGKYSFRNLESINAALKPLCAKHGCGYFLTDEVVLIGERFYTKATATFWTNGSQGEISSTAYAREEDEKKGMDEAQISGLASSYARKYAMCGLFAIDSGEEVDGMDNRSAASGSRASDGRGRATVKKDRQTAPQQAVDVKRQRMIGRCEELGAKCIENGMKPGAAEGYMKAHFKVESVSELNDEQLVEYGTYLASMERQSAEQKARKER